MKTTINNKEYLVIVSVSARWPRQHEYDMPITAEVRQVISQQGILFPEEFIYQFNAQALDSDALRWAGLTTDFPEVGKMVRLIPVPLNE